MTVDNAIYTNNQDYDAYGPMRAPSGGHMDGSTGSGSSTTGTSSPAPVSVSCAADKPVMDLATWQKQFAPPWSAERHDEPGAMVSYGGYVYAVPGNWDTRPNLRPDIKGSKWLSHGTVEQNYQYYLHQPSCPPAYSKPNKPLPSEKPCPHEPIYVQGPPGKDGLNGKDGKDGVDGKDGKDGNNGLDGSDGLPGEPGKNGIDGNDGQSIVGPRGPRGPQGPRGEDGRDGKDGKDGKLSIRDRLVSAGWGFVGGFISGYISGTIPSLKDLPAKAHEFIHKLKSLIPGATQEDEDAADHDVDQAIGQNPEVIYGKPVSTRPAVLPGPNPPPPYGVPQPVPPYVGFQQMENNQWGIVLPDGRVVPLVNVTADRKNQVH